MKGKNVMMLCHEEMCRILARALNEDRLPECEIAVLGVTEETAVGFFAIDVEAAPPKPQVLVNRPPPPHDNAPEHEARHA